MTIKIGDVVELKCGGPRMVVVDHPDEVTAKDVVTVHVTWIDAKGECKHARFPVVALKIVEGF